MSPFVLPTVYRHYKGGQYLVLTTAETHNHNGDIDVVYVVLSTGKTCTRPLRRDSRNEDAWLDNVPWPDGVRRDRFVPESHLGGRARDALLTMWERGA
jgi:hypothetical protein